MYCSIYKTAWKKISLSIESLNGSKITVEEKKRIFSVLLFWNTINRTQRIFRRWNCLLLTVATDGKHGHGSELEKVDPDVSSFSAMLISVTAIWAGVTRRRLVLCLQKSPKISDRSRGGTRRGAPPFPRLILDQSEARKAEKKFLILPPLPPALSEVLDPPLKVCIVVSTPWWNLFDIFFILLCRSILCMNRGTE